VNRFDIAVHPLESGIDFGPGYTEQAGVEHVWQPPFNARLYREQGNGDSGQVTGNPESYGPGRTAGAAVQTRSWIVLPIAREAA
jgi:hypothetical protein